MGNPEVKQQDGWLIEDAPPSGGTAPVAGAPWKVLVVDDEPDVHAVTRLALHGVTYKGRGLELMCADSAKEGLAILFEHKDVALILLDVVMESEHAGLDMVKVVRGELGNHLVRIVLRTGQPGQAPEQEVILSYDINDYKAKTELTAQKLFTTVIASLRAYENLRIIEHSRQGLDSILAASVNLYQIQSLRELASGMLYQIGAILGVGADGILCVSECHNASEGPLQVIAATGMFSDLQTNQQLDSNSAIYQAMQRAAHEHACIFEHPNSVLYFPTQSNGTFVLYFTPPYPLSEVDQELLRIYSIRLSAAFDNLYYHAQMKSAQAATVVALAGLAEFRDSDAGDHVQRVQRYTSAIAHRMAAKRLYPEQLTPRFLDLIGMASILHDVGKVGTPDPILHKPGKLDPAEWAIMKQHASVGAQILAKAATMVEGASYLSMGAEIATSHHEHFDGGGYPKGLSGQAIPLSARIVAVVDVFDALLHPRPYRELWPIEQVLAYIRTESGRHFDPDVATTLLELVTEQGNELPLPP